MKKLLILCVFIGRILFAQNDFETIKQHYFKSYDYEQMGKYDEAIKVLAPLYTKYPKGYTLNLRFGWLFFLSKKYNDALQYYQKAQSIQPHALDPKLGTMRVYLAQGSSKKAEMLGYKILKTDYYNYYGNYYTILALINQKKYDVATKIIQKILALYPTDVLFLEQLARIYKATNNKYLRKLYEDILVLDPNNVLVRSVMK